MMKELQDIAWNCLPKEFKEEVKKVARIYSGRTSALFGAERHLANKFLDEFIGLFGLHNLTSDAEGEEMLTVSRKRVQEVYAKNIAASNSDGHNSYDYGYYDGVINILSTLFGSKCLPDEEPKPAEPKFKVGDYVRYKGGVHKVVATAKDNRCYLNKILGCIDESDLEPYTEPEKNIAENHNLSQSCDKEFINILKNSFSKERRLAIAAQMMQGLICAPLVPGVDPNPPAEYLAQAAVRLADALIAEAEKEDCYSSELTDKLNGK